MSTRIHRIETESFFVYAFSFSILFLFEMILKQKLLNDIVQQFQEYFQIFKLWQFNNSPRD